SGLIEALDIYLTALGVTFLIPLLAFLLVIGALAEINSWIIGPVKALHTTSAHGNLPPFFQKLNKHGTPTNLLFAQASIVTLASCVILLMPTLSASYWILSAISAQMYLIMYVFMFIAAIRLRYTHPHVTRSYKIPHPHKGMWIVASVGMVSSIFVIGISFIPPTQLHITNIFAYELFLWGGLITMSIIPLLIYRFKKESWKGLQKEE
ncbi:amino acid permease, partial [Candidatus Aerophobetes bacterium]